MITREGLDDIDGEIENQRVEVILDLAREAYEAWVQTCVEQHRSMDAQYMTYDALPTADNALLFDMTAAIFDALVVKIQTQEVWWI